MHPLLNIAIKAARRAGQVILRNAGQLDRLNVETKGVNDFVTQVDVQAETEIIRIIHAAYPNHAVLAEESGRRSGEDYLWIVDPLDGTTNYVHGYPAFSVSIALQHKGKLDQAVVFDPLRDELFTASRGAGAHLNDRRIRVSRVQNMAGALIGTGFPYKTMTHLETWIEMFRTLLPQCSGVRRAGSAALDLANVAAGRLDGFWEIGLNPWDIAAGCLLIQEAGGMVSDLAGTQHFLSNGNVVGGNPRIHSELLRVLEPHVPAELRAATP